MRSRQCWLSHYHTDLFFQRSVFGLWLGRYRLRYLRCCRYMRCRSSGPRRWWRRGWRWGSLILRRIFCWFFGLRYCSDDASGGTGYRTDSCCDGPSGGINHRADRRTTFRLIRFLLFLRECLSFGPCQFLRDTYSLWLTLRIRRLRLSFGLTGSKWIDQLLRGPKIDRRIGCALLIFDVSRVKLKVRGSLLRLVRCDPRRQA